MPNVFKIALPGYNAVTDTDPNHFSLFVDGAVDHVLIKEKSYGTTSVNGTVNVAHNLSYVPFCLVFVGLPAGQWRKLYSFPLDSSGYWFEINTTNLVLKNTTGTSRTFAYHIFYDNLT